MPGRRRHRRLAVVHWVLQERHLEHHRARPVMLGGHALERHPEPVTGRLRVRCRRHRGRRRCERARIRRADSPARRAVHRRGQDDGDVFGGLLQVVGDPTSPARTPTASAHATPHRPKTHPRARGPLPCTPRLPQRSPPTVPATPSPRHR